MNTLYEDPVHSKDQIFTKSEQGMHAGESNAGGAET
jgi:hypothetical protein